MTCRISDVVIAGPYFPRRGGKDSPPKTKSPKSLFQMYFNPKMLGYKMGSDKDYDRHVTDFYASYYDSIVSVCRIGIKSDFVSGDLVSLCECDRLSHSSSHLCLCFNYRLNRGFGESAHWSPGLCLILAGFG